MEDAEELVVNDSEQFEARFLSVSIEKNNSPFFEGMEGSILPIAVAHGEGKANFRDDTELDNAIEANIISLKYVDNYNKGTLRYPFNPNGSVLGITGLGDTLESAINNAYDISEKISWENKYLRTDIGKKGLSHL